MSGRSRAGSSTVLGASRERAQYLAARLLSRLPDAVKIRLSGEPPIVVDGQQLDPQLQLLRSAVRGRPVP